MVLTPDWKSSAESSNEAYKVISSFTGVLVKNSVVNAVSVNQPINALPAPNDSGSLLIVSPFLTVMGATGVPSPASKVTVTSSSSAGLFSLYVTFAVIVFLTPSTVISLLAVTLPLAFGCKTSSANTSAGSAVREITAHKNNDKIFLPCFFFIPSTVSVPPDITASVSHSGQSVPPVGGLSGLSGVEGASGAAVCSVVVAGVVTGAEVSSGVVAGAGVSSGVVAGAGVSSGVVAGAGVSSGVVAGAGVSSGVVAGAGVSGGAGVVSIYAVSVCVLLSPAASTYSPFVRLPFLRVSPAGNDITDFTLSIS